jgi:hypothetical protein
MSKQHSAELLPCAEHTKLVRLVEQRGVLGAARALGASRGVVERACGNLPLRRGSMVNLLIGLRGLETK